MKNTGLKIPEKDQIYVYVGFSYYLRAILNVNENNTRVEAFKKLEETMHVHT